MWYVCSIRKHLPQTKAFRISSNAEQMCRFHRVNTFHTQSKPLLSFVWMRLKCGASMFFPSCKHVSQAEQTRFGRHTHAFHTNSKCISIFVQMSSHVKCLISCVWRVRYWKRMLSCSDVMVYATIKIKAKFTTYYLCGSQGSVLLYSLPFDCTG